MRSGLAASFAAIARSLRLGLVLLAANAGFAALLAAPLALVLDRDLGHAAASERMRDGFDFGWWSAWSDRQGGFTAGFGPDILGAGFAFKNADLLLRGELPAGLLGRPLPAGDAPARGGARPAALDPTIAALGLAYLLFQTFLSGGVLATLRGPRGSFTTRGLVHASGFYFGRLLRVALLALAAQALLFWLAAPLLAWADARAREAVSDSGALAWSLGRNALLLLAILVVSALSSLAKAVVVIEDRASAALAWLSALGYALRHPLRLLGHYLALFVLGLALVAVFAVVERALGGGGAATLAWLLLAELLMLGRLLLRLGLYGGQIALYRSGDAGA